MHLLESMFFRQSAILTVDVEIPVGEFCPAARRGMPVQVRGQWLISELQTY